MKVNVDGFETAIMKFRFFDFNTGETIFESDTLYDLIHYFNTVDRDFNHCFIQVYELKSRKYITIGTR